jgi:ABC-type glutathione transport system ATPase component
MSEAPLLLVQDARVTYRSGRRRPPTAAIDGVSLQVGPGETVGLVGESGSGKTTLARAILGLVPLTSGTVTVGGKPAATGKRSRAASGFGIQAVFQNPYGSLNPARSIGKALAEPLSGPGQRPSRPDTTRRVAAMLERIGLPADAAHRYPGEFSGGQLQRIAIARAFMSEPRLVVCDEPSSALDVSVQAQVLNMLADFQQTTGVSYLFISHELSVVRHLADRVVVLYHGKVVEEGAAGQVYSSPSHPYTQALLAAVPVIGRHPAGGHSDFAAVPQDTGPEKTVRGETVREQT